MDRLQVFIKFIRKLIKSQLMMNLKFLFGILLFIGIAGCKTSPKAPEPSTEGEKSLGFDQLEEMKSIYYRFPSPDEMLSIIDKEKIKFSDRLVLPVDNSKSFLDSRSQALNLGVYIADLAYISLFQRQKETLTYFQVVYGLSDKLRISSAFDVKLMQRFEENLKFPDSLKALTNEAMTNVTNYLVQNDKEKTFAIISIGGYVESLYLAFNIVGNYDENNQIIQRISDQKLVLENLINYALIYASDNNVAESIKLLHPIRSCYNELNATQEDTKVSRGKDGKLIISGGQKITISEEQYNKLRDVTFATRKNITENKEN
jgi:hypothetical protein